MVAGRCAIVDITAVIELRVGCSVRVPCSRASYGTVLGTGLFKSDRIHVGADVSQNCKQGA